MHSWLLYWKEYWNSIDYSVVRNGWHTRQEPFFRHVQRGDSLWIIVNGGSARPGKWLLLMRIVVRSKRSKSTYRPYCILGDPRNSSCFDLKSQDDLAPLLHKLQFATGNTIKVSGRLIAQTLQTIRPLSDEDGLLFEKYSKKLARL
jgi:hypothetical protein